MRGASDAADPGTASSARSRARTGSSATTAVAGSSITSRSSMGSILPLTMFVVKGMVPALSHSGCCGLRVWDVATVEIGHQPRLSQQQLDDGRRRNALGSVPGLGRRLRPLERKLDVAVRT